MIGVYAVCRLKEGQQKAFEALAEELAQASRQEVGCLQYRYGKIKDQDNAYAFMEQWQSQAHLEAHFQQPHFLRAGEALGQLLASALEISVVELAD
ncbi:MAG: putative quinol monooxygenase [Cardiobacteriaceae bacterium]|nr:putative quinol monooxygenase [Cardiobacteriaceae bacterium]